MRWNKKPVKHRLLIELHFFASEAYNRAATNSVKTEIQKTRKSPRYHK